MEEFNSMRTSKLMVGMITMIIFSSCTKTKVDDPVKEICHLDSVWTRLDPSYSWQKLIYNYDDAGRLVQRMDYASDYFLDQTNEFHYDAMGRYNAWKLYGRNGDLLAEQNCFFDGSGKPAGSIMKNYLVNPAQVDSIHYSYAPNTVTQITRTNNITSLKIEYEFQNENMTRRTVYWQGSPTMIDSVSYGTDLAPELDRNEAGGFIYVQLKSKNLPTRKITYSLIEQKRTTDENYTYTFDDDDRLIKRITRSNLPPHPQMPGNEKEDRYFWSCEQALR